MRLVLRILGTDVVELSTDRDLVEHAPATDHVGAVVGTGSSPDLTLGGAPFGFTPHDEPLTWDE